MAELHGFDSHSAHLGGYHCGMCLLGMLWDALSDMMLFSPSVIPAWLAGFDRFESCGILWHG